MWSASDGKELAVVSGRGIGVRLCVFFADNVRVASSQEKAVLVSVHVLVVMIIAVCAGSQALPSLSSLAFPYYKRQKAGRHLKSMIM